MSRKTKKEEATWTTSDGRTLPVRKMEDTHVLNAVRHLERRIEEENDKLDASVPDKVRGDVATYYAMRETSQIADTVVLLCAQLTAMRDEVDRRKLDLAAWCVTCQSFHRKDQTTCDTVKCPCGYVHPKPINEFHARALGCSA